LGSFGSTLIAFQGESAMGLDHGKAIDQILDIRRPEAHAGRFILAQHPIAAIGALSIPVHGPSGAARRGGYTDSFGFKILQLKQKKSRVLTCDVLSANP
jgi:hypothetical protein